VKPCYLTPSNQRVWLALDWLVLVVALVGLGFVVGGYYFTARYADAKTVPSPGAVVRVLDIVVRDSNTTNRRQRFECRPTDVPSRESK
jgi:hypothetical protein